MDWLITSGLMLLVLMVTTFSMWSPGSLLKKTISEKLRSQEQMQVGFAWVLTSAVPFLRGYPALGVLSILVGVINFLLGCFRAYAYGKKKARDTRLAEEKIRPSRAANDDSLDQEKPFLTRTAAVKNSRRHTRKTVALSNADAPTPQPLPLRQSEPQ